MLFIPSKRLSAIDSPHLRALLNYNYYLERALQYRYFIAVLIAARCFYPNLINEPARPFSN